MTPDLARVADIIARVAAEEIAPHYKRLAKSAVRTKSSPGDFVTAVDEAAERAYKSALLAIAPDAVFIGEESAAADPASVASLSGPGRFWVVDPLDGTRNFIRGVDEFGSIVAFVEDGRTRAGWIYAIPHRGMAAGSAGGGVRWRGAPIKTQPQRDGRPSGLRSVGWLKPEWKERLARSLKASVDSRPAHCSAYAYLALIQGEADFHLLSRVHPWDHAAGALLLEDAGGAARWLDTGAPYAPQESQDRPLLTTAPGRDWDDIARRLLS